MRGWVGDIEEQERKMRYIALVLLLAVSLVPSAQAGGIGRLFFTPEQRTQLEYNRAHNAAAAAAEEGDTTSVLMINGIVQKQGGGRTVWINGKAQNAGDSDERSPESLAVSVPGKSQPVRVKVGQKLLLDNPLQPKPVLKKPPKSDD